MLADLRGEKLLTQALRRFPKLKTVTVDHQCEAFGTKELSDAFGSFHASDLLDARGLFTFPALITALANSGAEIIEFNITIGRVDLLSFLDGKVGSSLA